MKIILILLLCISIYLLIDTLYDMHIEDVTMYCEYGYFEGQKDALENDIRIKKNGDKWEWSKSCWNSGKKTLYNP